MAIAGNGSFLKGLRGSAVNLTFKGFHDETVVQGKRAKGTFTPSPETLAAQSVAAQLSAIYRLIRAAVVNGFTSKASNQSEYNAWYSENYGEAFDLSSPPTATFLPAGFVATKGVMTPTPILTTVADVSNESVTTTFASTVADASQELTDYAITVIHNRTQDKWHVDAEGTDRTAGTQVTGVPPGFMVAGNTIDVYTGWKSTFGPNAGLSSISIYSTTAAVA